MFYVGDIVRPVPGSFTETWCKGDRYEGKFGPDMEIEIVEAVILHVPREQFITLKNIEGRWTLPGHSFELYDSEPED